jgi:hypothetical protein
MKLQLLTGAYPGRSLPTVRYPKSSKPGHYIFMWSAGLLEVEISQLQ